MKKSIPFILLVASLLGTSSAFAGFSWQDEEGKHKTLFYNNRLIARYMYEPIDESSKERREETYKPFYHIFDFDNNKEYITKGPGGKFPHHRGIYYGFSKCSYTDAEGKEHTNIDTWHCRQAHQVHREFLEEKGNDDGATLSTRIDWIDNEGKAFASEARTLTFSFDGKDLVVDFASTLTPLIPKMRVDGDPQHAGFQFRASNEVAEKTAKQTYYIRPGSGKADPGKTINWDKKNDTEATRDLPWKGMSFVANGKRYTVAYLDDQGNPKPARYSERDYGRFGSYFAKDIAKDKPLTVNYRLVLRKGEMSADEISGMSDDFAP